MERREGELWASGRLFGSTNCRLSVSGAGRFVAPQHAKILYPVLREMPNSLQRSAIGSPASRRATNCSLSSMTEHSLQGIHFLLKKGRKCNLCVRYVLSPMCQAAHVVREPRNGSTVPCSLHVAPRSVGLGSRKTS